MRLLKYICMIGILTSTNGFFIGSGFSDLDEFGLRNLLHFEHPEFGYRIIGLEAGVLNNSFTLSQYNQYSGAFLDNRAKDEILHSIPETGMWLNAGANLTGFDLIFRNFGFSVFGTGSYDLKIPKDVFDLALYGNQINRRYEADGLSRQSISFWGISASHNLRIKQRFQFGLAARYLSGISIFETLRSQGYLLTTPTYVASEGSLSYRLGRGGNGAGLDLIFSYDILPDLRTILALINLNTGMNWTKNPELGQFSFNLDSINWSRLQKEDFFTENDSRKATEPFRTALPFYLILGTSYRLCPSLRTGFILKQIFNESSTNRLPRLFGTLEFRGLRFLPLECGLSVGGSEGFGMYYSIGFIYRKFSWSYSVHDLGGFFLGAKGTTINFFFGYNLYPVLPNKPSTRQLPKPSK